MADSIMLRIPVDDNGTDYIMMEVDRSDVASEVSLAAAEDDRVVDATTSIVSAMRRLGPVVRTVLAQLKAFGPDQFGLQFGVKFGGETGIIIAKGTAEASFTVTATWQRRDEAPANTACAHRMASSGETT